MVDWLEKLGPSTRMKFNKAWKDSIKILDLESQIEVQEEIIDYFKKRLEEIINENIIR